MVRQILAVVQKEDGVFVASFVDANINGSGESQLDAVEMLKDMVASTFRLLSKKEDVLGEACTASWPFSGSLFSGVMGGNPLTQQIAEKALKKLEASG